MSQPLLLLLVLLCEVQARGFREDTLPYEPTVKNECKDRELEYYNRNARMCCSKCPPGHHLFRECRNTTDSECKPCGPNAYTEVWNRMKQCHHCEAPCRQDSGLIETQGCNASHNRICGCSAGKYCAFESFTSCQVCADRTICQKGFGVSVEGTINSNTVCSPCPVGTFSDEESYTSLCKPHTKCRSLSVPGDSTHDAICADSEVGRVPTHVTHSVKGPSEAGEPVSELLDLEDLTEIWTPSPARVAAKNITTPIGVICGGILFAILGIAGIAFLFASRKTRYCASNLSTKTTCLNTANEKKMSQGQQIPSALKYNSPVQEQELLLKYQRLSTCSLDPMPCSAIVGEKPEKMREPPETPKRGLTSIGMMDNNGVLMNSERSGSGNDLVNLTCIVTVGNAHHHSLVAKSAAEPRSWCNDKSLLIPAIGLLETSDVIQTEAVTWRLHADIISECKNT
ncbi:hypothetical protein NDU88_011639 [Pleurodeles waltl]|uniref:TNFR-Cys domain-containing protein n=1 Tax=Pleurodeles waltl TaxID=8319 RepID=A0AAV7QZC7_PLEWA|nr:hypothetical protein NDU88_011639 [Pleurodeles waltl]